VLLRAQLLPAPENLVARPRLEAVWLFGRWARGKATRCSDVHLLVKGMPTDPGETRRGTLLTHREGRGDPASGGDPVDDRRPRCGPGHIVQPEEASCVPSLSPLGLLALGLLLTPPARALDRIDIRLPLVESNLSLRLSELRSPQGLLQGSSDLAELDQATDGACGDQLLRGFQAPLPISVDAVVREPAGSPLLEQVLLIVEALVQVEGL
jgi:hypothetical protein